MITETQITNDLIIEMKIPTSQRYESTKQQEAYVATCQVCQNMWSYYMAQNYTLDQGATKI